MTLEEALAHIKTLEFKVKTLENDLENAVKQAHEMASYLGERQRLKEQKAKK